MLHVFGENSAWHKRNSKFPNQYTLKDLPKSWQKTVKFGREIFLSAKNILCLSFEYENLVTCSDQHSNHDLFQIYFGKWSRYHTSPMVCNIRHRNISQNILWSEAGIMCEINIRLCVLASIILCNKVQCNFYNPHYFVSRLLYRVSKKKTERW